MISAVAFDLDGTLIDSTDAIVECFMLAFEELGEPPPTRDVVVNTIGPPLEDQFSLLTDLDPGHCAKVYRAFYADIGRERTTLLPEAIDCLGALADVGLSLGVATSKERGVSEMLMRHLGVIHHFESFLGPGDVEFPKPHPAAVLKSMEELGATADEFLFVGDSEFDIRAAKAAGVRCVAVTTGYRTRAQLESEEPQAIVDSLGEVRDFVLKGRN